MKAAAFTLIELLVVITIIAVLMGLAFPVFQSIQNSAKKTQAKNDLVQIVTAVNAFYTEYGRYPTTLATDSAATYETGGPANDVVFVELRGAGGALNTRQITFISPPDVKDPANPQAGITSTGRYYDPWGTPYRIALDADYTGTVGNPYSANAGAVPDLRTGVIAWSVGIDQGGGSGNKNTGTGKDDVISWQ